MVQQTASHPDLAVGGGPARPGVSFLLPLVLITAAGPVSMQIFLPAVPALSHDLAIDHALAQLTISAPLLAFGIAMLAYGPLSDRFGRRPPLLVGAAFYLAGAILCLLAPNIELLVAGRMLSAIGGAGGMVLTRAIVRDLYPPERVAGVISQLTVGQIVLPMISPALGGFVTEIAGWRANFLVLLVVGLLSALFAFRLHETHLERTSEGGAAGLLLGFWRLLRMRRFNGFALFSVAAIAAFFVFISGAPLVAADALGLSPSVFGLYLITVSLGFMTGNIIAARISHRFGSDRMVVMGGLIAATGAAAGLALALSGIATTLTLFGPAVILALGNGLALNNAQAGAMAVDPRAAGAAAGLTGFLQMVAASSAVQVMGALHDGTPMPLMILMVGTSFGALVLYALFNLRRTG